MGFTAIQTDSQPASSPDPNQPDISIFMTTKTIPSILIVDDDSDMRFLLRQIMEQENYRVIEAESGEESLVAYSKFRPDIVLLDGLLPVMDGFEVCARLQTMPGGDRTPVLIITGLNDNDSVNEAFKAGATDYITKPIHRAVLRQRVRRLLATRQGEEVLRLRERALAATSNGIMITNPNQNGNPIGYVNAAFKSLTGYSEEEVLDRSWQFLNGPDTDQFSVEQIETAIENIEEYKTILKHYRKNGTWFWDEISVYPVYDSTGILSNFVGVMQDVTERKQAEEDLYQANQELIQRVNELHQRTQEINLLSEMGGLFHACRQLSEGYNVVTDMAPRLFKTESGILFIRQPEQTNLKQVTAWNPLDSMVSLRADFSPDECWAIRRGRMHIVEDTQRGLVCKHVENGPMPAAYMCVPLIAQGESLGVMYLSNEIGAGSLPQSKQQLAQTVAEQIGLALANLNLQETLRNQSIRDPLTGLYNRRYLEEALGREMRRGSRSGRSVGIIMIDIDHFKTFNDTYGHAAGDRVLKEVANYLQHSIRGEDVACRYGGEEFLLVLPEINPVDAWQRAETIREAIREIRIELNGQPISQITVSLGVAVFPDQGTSGDTVIRAADEALYRAKEQGRDQVVMGARLD